MALKLVGERKGYQSPTFSHASQKFKGKTEMVDRIMEEREIARLRQNVLDWKNRGGRLWEGGVDDSKQFMRMLELLDDSNSDVRGGSAFLLIGRFVDKRMDLMAVVLPRVFWLLGDREHEVRSNVRNALRNAIVRSDNAWQEVFIGEMYMFVQSPEVAKEAYANSEKYVRMIKGLDSLIAKPKEVSRT